MRNYYDIDKVSKKRALVYIDRGGLEELNRKFLEHIRPKNKRTESRCIIEKEKNMNKVVLMGRLARDVEVRYSTGATPIAIGRYTLAMDRRIKKDGEVNADFINCLVFGKSAEFAEKYFTKGLRVTICGRIQTGSYTNKDGVKVYTTEVVVEEQEFADSKQSGAAGGNTTPSSGNDFVQVPDDMGEELPFA